MKHTGVFKCMEPTCGFQYEHEVGPPNYCPACQGMYVEWLDFEANWRFDLKSNKWFKIKLKTQPKVVKTGLIINPACPGCTFKAATMSTAPCAMCGHQEP